MSKGIFLGVGFFGFLFLGALLVLVYLMANRQVSPPWEGVPNLPFYEELIVPGSVWDNFPTPYHTQIALKAREVGVTPSLALAIVEVESRFNPRAIGKNRNGTLDIGLFQLNSAYFCPIKHSSVDENIDTGLRYLRELIEIFGVWEMAVLAYNQGVTRTLWGVVLEPSRTYLNRVASYKYFYHRMVMSRLAFY